MVGFGDNFASKPDRSSPSDRDDSDDSGGGPPEDDNDDDRFSAPDRSPPDDDGGGGPADRESTLDDVTPSDDPGLGQEPETGIPDRDGPPEDDGNEADLDDVTRSDDPGIESPADTAPPEDDFAPKPDTRGPTERQEQEQVAEQTPGVAEDDIEQVERIETEDGPDQLRAELEGPSAADRFETRRERAREQADVDAISRLGAFESDQLRFRERGGRVSATPTDAAADRRQRQLQDQRVAGMARDERRSERTIADAEAEIRQSAAESDPLRDPEDFVVQDDGGVRRRAQPFFEEQREALGFSPPDESGIRRDLQRGSAAFSQAARADPLPGRSPTEIAESELGVESRLFVGDDIQTGGAEALNAPGAALGAATTAEQAANVGQAELETRARELRSGDPATDELGDVSGLSVPEDSAAAEERQATAAAAEQVGRQVATTAQERPGLIIGGVAAGAALSAGSGVALGRGLRAGRGRVRTVGGTEIETSDIINEDTRRVFEEGEGGDPFPPFRDEDLARSDTPEAVRQQADEFTPVELEDAFEGSPGSPDDPVLFKALDTEPEGPATRRSAQGLETQEGSFESPGAFVGPELSPNFLRLSSDRDFSLRPGLPDTGGQPTAVAVRTDVEEPDADTLQGFNEELLDRSGETTAFTKPADEVNVGEAEAVIPGEARFADVGGGPIRNSLRRSGIGADFFTEIDGQRVPIRTVAPDEGGRVPSLLDDARGQVGAGSADRAAFSGRLSEIGRVPESPTDRPTPLSGTGVASPNAPSQSSTSGSEPQGSMPRTPGFSAIDPSGSAVFSSIGRGSGSSGPGAASSAGGSGSAGSSGFGSGGSGGSGAGAGGSGGGGGSSGGGGGSGGSTPPPGSGSGTRPRFKFDPDENEDEDLFPDPTIAGVREVEARLAPTDGFDGGRDE